MRAMKAVILIPTLILVVVLTTIECTVSLRILNEKQLNSAQIATNLRIRRLAQPLGKARKHKYRKIEIIPADESLRKDQFSEDIEDELGGTRIGKQAGNKRRRRGHNKRACIYIDIPGSDNPDEEVDIIIPGALTGSNFNGAEGIDDSLAGQQSMATTLSSFSADAQQLQANEDQQITNSAGMDDLESIYWLKLPPSETVRSKEVLKKLYTVVNDFHQSGKDVLFIPISKGYLDADEVKNGFLKTMQVNPIDREKNLKNFEIKLM